jgi:hypothetical protein
MNSYVLVKAMRMNIPKLAFNNQERVENFAGRGVQIEADSLSLLTSLKILFF